MNLLFAAVLLMQDRTAEETFKKLEETLEKAKTLSLNFKVAFVKQAGLVQNMTIEGTAHFKEGNKASITALTTVQGETQEYSGVSDGSRLRRGTGKAETEVTAVPADFLARFETALSRAGMLFAFVETTRPSAVRGRTLQELKKDLEVSNFKLGEDKSSLSYTLRFPESDPKMVATCVLRYEPKTLTLLGRKMTLTRNGEDEGVYTDTYEGYTLNADIPDEKFRLPGEKK
jgi:hypothetical protein